MQIYSVSRFPCGFTRSYVISEAADGGESVQSVFIGIEGSLSTSLRLITVLIAVFIYQAYPLAHLKANQKYYDNPK